jgi:hypothetical protein
LSPQGVDQDDIVVMPYTSAMKRVIGGTTLRNINVQIADARHGRSRPARSCSVQPSAFSSDFKFPTPTQ